MMFRYTGIYWILLWNAELMQIVFLINNNYLPFEFDLEQNGAVLQLLVRELIYLIINKISIV